MSRGYDVITIPSLDELASFGFQSEAVEYSRRATEADDEMVAAIRVEDSDKVLSVFYQGEWFRKEK